LSPAMNIRFLTVTLVAPMCILADEPGKAKSRVSQESMTLVKTAHPYQAPASLETEKTMTPDDEVVQMEPFVVNNTRLQRDVSMEMDGRDRNLKAGKFTFTKGGLIHKNERIDVGLSPHRDPISGKVEIDAGNPKLLIELIRFKF